MHARYQLALMTLLPPIIRVRIAPGPGISPEGLLVGLTFRQGLQDYFSTLLGLTDASGGLSVTSNQIADAFAQSQQLFPMDYKLRLDECDSLLIDLAGGSDFAAQQASALKSPLLNEHFRQMWAVACNAGVAATTKPVPLDGRPADVTLPARRIGVP